MIGYCFGMLWTMISCLGLSVFYLTHSIDDVLVMWGRALGDAYWFPSAGNEILFCN
jgi:hypothetical protein